MSEHGDTERVARWLAGEMTPSEAAALEREAERDPSLAALLRDARQAWDSTDAPAAPDPDVDAAWVRFSAAVGADTTPARRAVPVDATPVRNTVADARVIRLPRRQQQPRRVLTPLRAAAAVVLMIAAALVWRAARPSGEALVTAAGEHRTWTLPDGSTVMLGPASSLTVPAGYGTRHREVRLTGEGRFVAAAAASTPPLTIAARDAHIIDIGTAFIVRAFPGSESPVRVVVTQGAVWLGPEGGAGEAGVTLREGQLGTYNDASGARLVGAADTAMELAWTRGRVVFDDAPLDEVAYQLERWYGVDVRMEDARSAGRRLTAAFEGEPLDEVLDIVARTLGMSVERTDGIVTFRLREGA